MNWILLQNAVISRCEAGLLNGLAFRSLEILFVAVNVTFKLKDDTKVCN